MYDPVALAVLLLCGACIPTLMGVILIGTSKQRRRPISRHLARSRGGIWKSDLATGLFGLAAGMAASAVLALSYSSLF